MQVGKMIKENDEDGPTALLLSAIVKEAPLKTMLMSSDGVLTREMLDALLIMINGKFFKGLPGLLRAIWNK
jgi:hypothetical protein